MTTTTLNDVRRTGNAPQETALRRGDCEPPAPIELVATCSVQARPTLALQRRLIAGLVG
jgi:hypothetical protein